MVDDLGWGDLGCYGQKLIKTPHLDQLAKQGVLFENAFATIGVCAPARSTIISGMYPPSIGSQHMVSPDFSDGPPDMFICGNDAVAKEVVSRICKDFGWGVVDLGGIEGSRYIEPLALIWITHLINTGSGDHVFKLLRK